MKFGFIPSLLIEKTLCDFRNYLRDQGEVYSMPEMRGFVEFCTVAECHVDKVHGYYIEVHSEVCELLPESWRMKLK